MDAYSYLHNLRHNSPLIHNMTNQVVTNFVANGLLALGASPIMAYAEEEIADITSTCHATALNIGTITSDTFHSMLLSGKAANELEMNVTVTGTQIAPSTSAVTSALD